MKLMNYYILKKEWSVYGGINSEKVCTHSSQTFSELIHAI